jgi:hypothetical protein
MSSTLQLDHLKIIGGNRGGKSDTAAWAAEGILPRHVTVIDREPLRSALMAMVWTEKLGVPADAVTGSAEHLARGDGASVMQWAIDDPRALASGLARSTTSDGLQQFSLQVAVRLPETSLSLPVISLAGGVSLARSDSVQQAHELLSVLGRMTMRTTSSDITRDYYNDNLIRPVRDISWMKNVRDVTRMAQGMPVDDELQMFVTRAPHPIYHCIYPLSVEVEDVMSRRLLRLRAKEQARKHTGLLSMAYSAVNPDGPRIFTVLLLRESLRSNWHVLDTLELPPPAFAVPSSSPAPASLGVFTTD